MHRHGRAGRLDDQPQRRVRDPLVQQGQNVVGLLHLLQWQLGDRAFHDLRGADPTRVKASQHASDLRPFGDGAGPTRDRTTSA